MILNKEKYERTNLLFSIMLQFLVRMHRLAEMCLANDGRAGFDALRRLLIGTIFARPRRYFFGQCIQWAQHVFIVFFVGFCNYFFCSRACNGCTQINLSLRYYGNTVNVWIFDFLFHLIHNENTFVHLMNSGDRAKFYLLIKANEKKHFKIITVFQWIYLIVWIDSHFISNLLDFSQFEFIYVSKYK